MGPLLPLGFGFLGKLLFSCFSSMTLEPIAFAPLGEEERGRIGEECAGWGMSSSTPVRTTGTGPGGHRAYAGVA